MSKKQVDLDVDPQKIADSMPVRLTVKGGDAATAQAIVDAYKESKKK